MDISSRSLYLLQKVLPWEFPRISKLFAKRDERLTSSCSSDFTHPVGLYCDNTLGAEKLETLDAHDYSPWFLMLFTLGSNWKNMLRKYHMTYSLLLSRSTSGIHADVVKFLFLQFFLHLWPSNFGVFSYHNIFRYLFRKVATALYYLVMMCPRCTLWKAARFLDFYPSISGHRFWSTCVLVPKVGPSFVEPRFLHNGKAI